MTMSDGAAELLATSRRLRQIAQVLWALAVLGIAGPLVVGLAGLSPLWIKLAGGAPAIILMAGVVVYVQARRYESRAVAEEVLALEAGDE